MISITLFTDDFEICSPDGSRKAEMKSGRLVSDDPEIFPFRPLGRRPAGHTVYMPSGTWVIKNQSPSENGLEFDAAETDLRVHFQSEELRAELTLNNDEDLCLVRLGEGSTGFCCASVYSGKDPGKGVARTDLSGQCKGGEAVLGIREGKIVMRGLSEDGGTKNCREEGQTE